MTLLSTLVSAIAISISVFTALATAVPAPQTDDPKKYSFHLRAWRLRRLGAPFIDHWAELESGKWGDVMINMTKDYTRVESYIDPTQKRGLLKSLDHNLNAYLLPLGSITTSPPTTSKHYSFHYNVEIPAMAGVLWANFTKVGRTCGGNCGGSMLDFDNGSERGMGEWYVVRGGDQEGNETRGNEEEDGVWRLRWMSVDSGMGPWVYPDGAVPVVLWIN